MKALGVFLAYSHVSGQRSERSALPVLVMEIPVEMAAALVINAVDAIFSNGSGSTAIPSRGATREAYGRWEHFVPSTQESRLSLMSVRL